MHDLEEYTDAVFVGEPSAGKPNSYGDSRTITLPNSGITVRVSIYYWQRTHPLDSQALEGPRRRRRADLAPTTGPTWIRRCARSWPETSRSRSLAERMRRRFAAGDSAGALKLHLAYKADPRHAYADTEVELNALGYELLRQGRHEQAIAVLRAELGGSPRLSNVFDCLGEAYDEAGRPDEAVRSYERALALDPANENARQMLEKLRGGAATYAGWRASRATPTQGQQHRCREGDHDDGQRQQRRHVDPGAQRHLESRRRSG